MLLRLIPGLAFLVLLVLYGWTLPHWPQAGDSTEIVVRGWTWGALHAPGYPLVTLYNSLLRVLPFANPVTSAAWLNLVPAIAALVVLYRAWGTEASRSGRALLVLLLGTHPLFWKYAVTPEVFALHLLFVAVFVEFALRPERYLSPAWTLLAALSVLHHHTIVFLAPVILRAAYVHRRHVRAHLVALAAGASALSGYLLLFLFDTSDAWSWYAFDSLSDVWRHFTRADYGTFRLAATAAAASPLDRILSFAEELFFGGVSLVLLCAWNYRSLRHTPRLRALQLLLALVGTYVVGFSFLSGLDPAGADRETWLRFCLMPLLLVVFVFGKMALHAPRTSSALAASVLALQLGWQVVAGLRDARAELRDVPAKHSLQLLTAAPKDAVLLTVGDTAFYMAAYWQTVRGLRPDVRVFPATATPAYLTKLIQLRADLFTVSVPGGPWLYQIDFARHPVLAMHGVAVPPGGAYPLSVRYHDTHLLLQKGAQPFTLDCGATATAFPSSAAPFATVSEAGILALQYGSCQLYRALLALEQQRPADALADVATGLKLNPFHFHLQHLQCDLLTRLGRDGASACAADLDARLAEVHPFYLQWKFALPPGTTAAD